MTNPLRTPRDKEAASSCAPTCAGVWREEALQLRRCATSRAVPAQNTSIGERSTQDAKAQSAWASVVRGVVGRWVKLVCQELREQVASSTEACPAPSSSGRRSVGLRELVVAGRPVGSNK